MARSASSLRGRPRLPGRSGPGGACPTSRRSGGIPAPSMRLQRTAKKRDVAYRKGGCSRAMPCAKEPTQSSHRISSPARPAPRSARPAPRSARPAPRSARPAPRSVRPSGQPAPPAVPPPAAAPGPRPARLRGVTLALILTAAFMVVLDFSIVNVALPSIETELGFPADAVQWIITAYAIAFGGLLILGGRAADLFGRRRMFIAGLLLFSAASLAGGLAHDPFLLVASRLVQGAGAALVAPAALSLITTGFSEGAQRNRALGLYGATASVGFVAGQVLGGVLVQFTTWRAVFLVNVPVGVLAVALAPWLLAESRQHKPGTRLDGAGAVLITVAVAAAVFVVSQLDVLGWTSPLLLAVTALAVAAA